MNLILYGRADCSLCRHADEALRQTGLSAQAVDIEADATLEARYGARIPVLRDGTDGRELDWPFDAYAIRRFYATNST